MLLKKAILFSHEHSGYFLLNIGHSLLRTSVVFIPNIQHSIFRTSVILCSEHPVFSVANIWTTFIPNIRTFQRNWSSEHTFLTDVRKKNKDEKGLPH